MTKQIYFEILRFYEKQTTPVVFGEESKTGLGFEIRQRQQKIQRKPSLQLLVNSAVPQRRGINFTWSIDYVHI